MREAQLWRHGKRFGHSASVETFGSERLHDWRSENQKPGPILPESPDSQFAKDPERGLANDL